MPECPSQRMPTNENCIGFRLFLPFPLGVDNTEFSSFELHQQLTPLRSILCPFHIRLNSICASTSKITEFSFLLFFSAFLFTWGKEKAWNASKINELIKSWKQYVINFWHARQLFCFGVGANSMPSLSPVRIRSNFERKKNKKKSSNRTHTISNQRTHVGPMRAIYPCKYQIYKSISNGQYRLPTAKSTPHDIKSLLFFIRLKESRVNNLFVALATICFYGQRQLRATDDEKWLALFTYSFFLSFSDFVHNELRVCARRECD